MENENKEKQYFLGVGFDDELEQDVDNIKVACRMVSFFCLLSVCSRV